MKDSEIGSRHILCDLISCVPTALFAVLLIFFRDVPDILLMPAAGYGLSALGSVLIVMHLQKDERELQRCLFPFILVIPLCLSALFAGGRMAWLFLLLESVCVGFLMGSAAETVVDAIRERRSNTIAKNAPAAKPAAVIPRAASVQRPNVDEKTIPADQLVPAQAQTLQAQTIPDHRGDPSAITFPVKDVIGEQLACCRYWNLWHTLHRTRSARDLSCCTWEINGLTGELRLVTSIQQDRYEDPQRFVESCTEQDIRSCGDEKLKDFTADKWRDYVPDRPPWPVTLRPALIVPAQACRPGKAADVDAYCMEHTRQVGPYEFETRYIYLRRCDTGWRLFDGSSIYMSVSFFRRTVEDEHRLRALTEFPYVYDRLLTADETAYVMNLLPDRHDGVRGSYSSQRFALGQEGKMVACYWKDGYCVDCAQLQHIPDLFETLAKLAERGLSVADGSDDREA